MVEAINVTEATSVGGYVWDPLSKQFIPHPHPKSIGDLLRLDIENDKGIYVFFMPRIENGLENANTLKPKLCKKFKIPPFFFEESGWNANGFFGSFDTKKPRSEGSVHVTYFRFLTKDIDPPTDPRSTEFKYEWDFLGFSTISRFGAAGAVDLQVLLCFDLTPHATQELPKYLSKFEESHQSEPFALINIVAEFVAFRFHHFLWKMQPLVRNIEKKRDEYIYSNKPEKDAGENSEDELQKVIARYTKNHELSRHLIHIMETLAVAIKTMKEITADHKALCLSDQILSTTNPAGSSISSLIASELEFSTSYVTSLHERAKSFVERIKNEIHLGFNMVAAVDSSLIRSIMDRTNEGKEFMDAIALATFIFLPAALISGFFGMNFFNLTPGTSYRNNESTTLVVSSKIWIFFLASVAFTAFFLVPFLLEVNLVQKLRLRIGALRRKWLVRRTQVNQAPAP